MSGIFGNFRIFAEMERDDEHRLRFRWYQLALPVVIGLLVMWWLFADDLRSLSLSDLPAGGNFKLALALVLALLWRLLSYYVYLAVGMVVAPLWIKGDKKK